MDLKTTQNLLKYGIFEIPDYQRGYSWGIEQLKEFFEDLEEVEYVREHYTGTITLIKREEEKLGYTFHRLYEVVDGQQRLITIHILLSCIYFRLMQLNINEPEILENIIKKGKPLLRLNNNDTQKFFEYLLNESEIGNLKNEFENKSQKSLTEAKRFFSKQLEKYKERKVLNLYNNLLTKFKINIFELDSECEVGLVFETMNDRGLQLSDIDKVKNYIIYICHRFGDEILAKETNRKFGEIFKNLITITDNSNVTKIENQFLKTAYLIYTGDTKELHDIHKKVKKDLIPKNIIHKEIGQVKIEFDEKKKDFINIKTKTIKSFNTFLAKASEEYSKILNCENVNEKTRLGLYKLKVLNQLETFTPILLAITTNPKFKTEYLPVIIDLLETYSMRVFGIGNKKSNTGISQIYELAYNIRESKLNFTEVKEKIKELILKNGNNRDFKHSILNEIAYDKINSNIIKYFLYENEIYLSKQNNSHFTLPSLEDFFKTSTKFTIEHISPQTNLPGDKLVINIHSFGNLVLTNHNQLLDNKNFQSKKKIYSNSELISERLVSLNEKWDDKEILERGKNLAKFALEKWKI